MSPAQEQWYSYEVLNTFTGLTAYFEVLGPEDNSGNSGFLTYLFQIYLTGGSFNTISNPLCSWNFEYKSGFPAINAENQFVGIQFAYDRKIYIFNTGTPSPGAKDIVFPRDALYIG